MSLHLFFGMVLFFDVYFEDIGKYLGHKFNSVTMDVYIDLTKERQKNIISKIEKLIEELDS